MAAVIQMVGDVAADNNTHSKNKLETTKSELEFSVQKRVGAKLNPLAKEFYPSYYSPNINQKRVGGKLNPLAKEFYPSYYCPSTNQQLNPNNNFLIHNKQSINVNFPNNQWRGNSFSQGNMRSNGRALRAQQENSIRRTVYVSDIDHNITEECLARLFSSCGQVIECRVCGDLRSVTRFAFVQFLDEHGARVALNMDATVLGYYPIRVLPSTTVIRPVNPTFLPRSEDEREMCYRTVFCSNIDNNVSQVELKRFFEIACGEVESAIVALNCSGMVLGTQPIRVSPSKTLLMPRVTPPTLL